MKKLRKGQLDESIQQLDDTVYELDSKVERAGQLEQFVQGLNGFELIEIFRHLGRKIWERGTEKPLRSE